MWCPLALFFYQDGKKFYSDFDDQKKPLSLTWEVTQQSLGVSGSCSGCEGVCIIVYAGIENLPHDRIRLKVATV